jgi:uncharacterized protein YfaT (DUF1175 family)
MKFDARKLLRERKVIAEINRHKWLESEIAGFDVGFEAAAEDWLKKHASAWIKYHEKSPSKKSAPSASKVSTKLKNKRS